ncbi:hypothetical protein AURDEDRAFT_169547 [Auricularia subglabra TFB-10046 SS5]|uniref:Uncharacterized protein n=1 Tax=Auricularia subglabra (strain TFB-10046 / SS5) TaxID=717982 RepID=J0WYR8_AURST|nr:hypothetical protein AURDEDRAFT_169547 [Auricularia subglabra TFB-10046 SS5]
MSSTADSPQPDTPLRPVNAPIAAALLGHANPAAAGNMEVPKLQSAQKATRLTRPLTPEPYLAPTTLPAQQAGSPAPVAPHTIHRDNAAPLPASSTLAAVENSNASSEDETMATSSYAARLNGAFGVQHLLRSDLVLPALPPTTATAAASMSSAAGKWSCDPRTGVMVLTVVVDGTTLRYYYPCTVAPETIAERSTDPTRACSRSHEGHAYVQDSEGRKGPRRVDDDPAADEPVEMSDEEHNVYHSVRGPLKRYLGYANRY